MFEMKQLQFQYTPQSETMCFDISVKAGEVLSLIGPSGSGKSTLLGLIAGFLTASQGSILVDGHPIQDLAIAERPVSMVFQQHNLFPHLDVFTNIALGISPSLKLNSHQKKQIKEALGITGLSGLSDRKPGSISGGQQQRVALTRALVRGQRLLLLDEAFAALGPAMREELLILVKQMVKENNMAALLVSHQPQDAILVSERTAFVDSGKILFVEPTRELLDSNRHSEVVRYLGSA